MMHFFANQPIVFDDRPRTIDGIEIRSLEQILARSRATPEFIAAVRAFRDGETSDRILYSPGSPPVKVFRVLMKLLEVAPELEIERVRIEAVSGCATYEGHVVVEPQNRRYAFRWDCAWRASQNRITNRWGFVDQAEAARRFGYQCFQYFDETST